MIEKKFTYLVEVIYEQVIVHNNGQPDASRDIELDVQIFTFSDDNKSVAKQNAQRFFDKTLRYGLERKGGSIIKSLVPPHAIKNIGIVDYNLFMEEQKELEVPETALITPDVEAAAEAAVIGDVVGSN